MTIKLKDYIKNPSEALSDEEWYMLYKLAYEESNDEEIAEELTHISAEVDELLK